MDNVRDLANKMRAKRAQGTHPYVLVLGAGASVSSGTSLNRTVVERVVGTYDLKKFDDYLSNCSDNERFAILRELVEGSAPSKGYDYLAELIQAGYFDLVLSTNFDPLLEDAITTLQMRRRDYSCLIHGVMEPAFIAHHLDSLVPRVKILKLHGDLFYCKFYFTGEQIERFPPAIERMLAIYLNQRDILVVGHGMRDSDINRCLENEGESIWYVGPNPPTGKLAEIMQTRHSEGNVVSGTDGEFDQFFSHLRELLLSGTAAASVDRIAQSIFSLSPPGGKPVGSGFLLADTGLVVTDSTILTRLGGPVAHVRPFSGIMM